MNSKIKELAERAGYLPDMFGVGHWNMPEFQEYTKLLIQECINVCKSSVGNSDYTTGRMHCAGEIKEHFGIK